ncbi:MAG: hypothetical protein WDM77_22255 [Steroidobacteraceae bacterium]
MPTECEDGTVNGPVFVAHHESHPEGEVQPLQHPHGARGNHGEPDQAADEAHRNIEGTVHGGLLLLVGGQT